MSLKPLPKGYHFVQCNQDVYRLSNSRVQVKLSWWQRVENTIELVTSEFEIEGTSDSKVGSFSMLLQKRLVCTCRGMRFTASIALKFVDQNRTSINDSNKTSSEMKDLHGTAVYLHRNTTKTMRIRC